jgi:GNAT superfamily N-acetyltransferase
VRFPPTAVRPLRAADVAAVTVALPGLPHTPTDKHEERLDLQDAGSATYLIAWQGGEPVGHVLVRSSPVSEQGVAAGCAELEDLFVCEEKRRRGVGRALLAAAEDVARAAGARRLGFGVSVANPSNAAARRLYQRCGYADSGLGEFMLGYTYWDELGRRHRDEELHRYVTKRLNEPWRQERGPAPA